MVTPRDCTAKIDARHYSKPGDDPTPRKNARECRSASQADPVWRAASGRGDRRR
jgi:hypothetical protein